MPLPYRIVTLQLLLCTVAAARFAGLGCFASLLSTAGWRVLCGPRRDFRVADDRRAIAGQAAGQGVVKFALTLLLMAGCIVAFGPAVGWFFCTFVLLQSMYVVGPLVLASETDSRLPHG